MFLALQNGENAFEKRDAIRFVAAYRCQKSQCSMLCNFLWQRKLELYL